ncbi:MAG: FG-GAP-like repeat-containing protein [bacterium]
MRDTNKIIISKLGKVILIALFICITSFKAAFAGSTPPAGVTTLSGLVSIQKGVIQLTWLSPGDDGTVGDLTTGSEFRIQYSSYSVAWSKDNAQIIISTTGVTPLTQQNKTITSLLTYTTYTFKIWTKDDNENWSTISNEAIVQTWGFDDEEVYVGGFANSGLVFGDVAWGDYDNDGDMDVLANGRDSSMNSQLRVYYNTGAGLMNSTPIEVGGGSDTGLEYGGVAWGDFDNDGDLDILTSGTDNSMQEQLRVYKNTGGSFDSNQIEVGGSSNTGLWKGEVAWGDYDNDGDLDVLASGQDSTTGQQLRIYKNEGDGYINISPVEVGGGSSTGLMYGGVAWGDYDDDGDLDVLASGSDSIMDFQLRIYENTGEGIINSNQIEVGGSSDSGLYYGDVAWGDYDNDGDLDLVSSGYDSSSNRQLRVYQNDGGTINTSQIEVDGFNDGLFNGGVAWGDFNNDGTLDLLASGVGITSEEQLRVYENSGGGSFYTNTIVVEEVGNDMLVQGKVEWCDYDIDGDIDILVSGWDGVGQEELKIYKNTLVEFVGSGAANTAPNQPAGFSVEEISDKIVFKWSPASDTGTGATPAAGLYYNLAVSTENSIGNDPATSVYGSPLLGNFVRPPKIYDSNTRYGIALDLPVGVTYYWAVAAIDVGLSSSSYSAIQSTYIPPNIPPCAISDLTAVIGVDEGEITLEWTAPGNDDQVGVADHYIVKWDTNQITTADFDSATTYIQSWTPITGGSDEMHNVIGFIPGTTYYFAIKAVDDEAVSGYWSTIGANTQNYAAAKISYKRYWVAASAGLWTDTSNWSTTSGGGGGASIPDPTQVAVFDGGSSSNCSIDTEAVVDSIVLCSTYTATVTVSSPTFKAISLTKIEGGTFSTNMSSITAGSYSQSGGMYNAGVSTITCDGSYFEITGGTYNYGNSTLVMDISNNNMNLFIDGYALNKVIVKQSGTFSRNLIIGSGTITINGSLQIDAANSGDVIINAFIYDPDVNLNNNLDCLGEGSGYERLYMGDGTWTVEGNINLSSATVNSDFSTLVMNKMGTGIIVGSGYLNNVTISTSAIGINSDVEIKGTLTVASGKNLQIAKDCELMMKPSSDIDINGSIEGPGILILQDYDEAKLGITGTIRAETAYQTYLNNVTIPPREFLGGLTIINEGVSNRTAILGTGTSQVIKSSANIAVYCGGMGDITLDAATLNPDINISNGSLLTASQGFGHVNVNMGSGDWITSGGIMVSSTTLNAGNSTVIVKSNAGFNPLSTGINNDVHAVAEFKGGLVAGGIFTQAGGSSREKITFWDGDSWEAMSTGMNGDVHALIVYNGMLIAGGNFTTAGGITVNRIAMWDGSSWYALGSGIGNGEVFALSIYKGKLAVGGSFTLAGGKSASRIALWNGFEWEAFSSGMNDTIYALKEYKDRLYAGGAFVSPQSRVAYWDGTSWLPLSGGLNNTVYAMEEHEDELFVGGAFTNQGNNIARWNGSFWSSCGAGVNNTVRSISVWNYDLMVGGDFTMVDGRVSKRIAGYYGAGGWDTFYYGADNTVNALASFQNSLVLGGKFNLVDDVPNTIRIAKYQNNAEISLSSETLNIVDIQDTSEDGVIFEDVVISTLIATQPNTKLYFKHYSTSAFTNVNINGQSNDTRIMLRSTINTTSYYWDVAGTQNISYADIRDCNASLGSTIDADDGTNVNSGNNVNWDFTASGTPADVTDLTALTSVDEGEIDLHWSSPGNDGTIGLLTGEYRIQYSTDTGVVWSTTTAQVTISTSNVIPLSQQNYAISGLDFGATYYFRLWTQNELSTWSFVSNGATNWAQVNQPYSKYWAATTDDQWANGYNWSRTPGGTRGAGAPDFNDTAVFGNGGSTYTCWVSTNPVVKAISIEAGYIGPVQLNAPCTSFTVTETFDIYSSTFNGYPGAVIEISTFTMSGGQFNAGSSTVSVSNDFTVSGGSCVLNMADFKLVGSNNQDVALSTNIAIARFIVDKPAGTAYMKSGMTVKNHFEIIDGTLDCDGGIVRDFYIEASSFTINGGASFNPGLSEFIFTDSGVSTVQEINMPGQAFNDLRMDRTFQTFQIKALSDINVANDFKVGKGIFEIVDSTVNVDNSFTYTEPSTGTVKVGNNGYLHIINGAVQGNGILRLMDGGVIQVDNQLDINNDGKLQSAYSVFPDKANFLRGNGSYFVFDLEGEINISQELIVLNSEGIVCHNSPNLSGFNNITFTDVTPGNAAIIIQDVTGDVYITSCTFNSNVSTNVYCQNDISPSTVTVKYAFGSKAGQDYENDFFARIEWFDDFLPGEITDFIAVTGSADGEIDLSWIAPGDDDSKGIVKYYDIRYSTYAVSNPTDTWDSLYVGDPAPPAPVEPGDPQVHTLGDLTIAPTLYIYIKAFDELGNYSWEESSGTMPGDYTEPDSGVSLPINNQWFNELITISGTASDNISQNIEAVKIAVKRKSDNFYFNGSGFTSTYTTMSVTIDNVDGYNIEWHYEDVDLDYYIEGGGVYEIYTYGEDLQGNYETVNATTTFKIDRSTPTSGIADPNQLFLNSLPIVSGTVIETPENSIYSITADIDIAIQENPHISGDYWTGLAFDSATIHWLTDVSTSTTATLTYWNYPSPTWADGTKYRVYTKAVDTAGNYELGNTSFTFTYDVSTPVARIENPSGSFRMKDTGIVTIQGTADDPNNGEVSQVQYRIKQQGGNYWDGASGFNEADGNAAWIVSDTSDGWANWNSTFTVSASNGYINEVNYDIEIRVVDSAGNYGVDYDTVTLTADFSMPQANITDPVNSYINSISAINGTSSDPFTGSIDKVRITVKQLSDGLFWTGANFTTPTTFYITASGTENWSYDVIKSTHLTHGTSYYIVAASSDTAGNIEMTPDQITFTYDIGLPTSTIESPVHDSVLNELVTISGTAVDEFGIGVVKVRIKRDDNKYWDGAAWVATETYLTASDTDYWYYDTDTVSWTSGSTYDINCRATDLATNLEIISSTTTFLFDNVAPTSYVQFPANNEFYSTVKTLPNAYGAGVESASEIDNIKLSFRDETSGKYWNGSDAFDSDVESWHTVNDTDTWTWAVPEAYLVNGRNYRMRTIATDQANNSETPSAGITFGFDLTEPDSAISNITDGVTIDPTGAIMGTASDSFAGAGEIEYYLRLDSGTFSPIPDGDDLYWNGSDWQASGIWISSDVQGTASSWFIDKDSITWVTGQKYWMSIKAKDNADNWETAITTTSFYMAKPATHLKVEGITSPHTAGTLTSVTVTALDDDNNTAFTYASSVTFTVLGGPETAGVELPSNYTFVPATDMGVHVFSNAVNLKKAGSRTVIVTDIDNGSINGSQSSIQVDSAALTGLQALVPGETSAPGTTTGKIGTPAVQTAGAGFTMTVNAVDNYFNVVSTDVSVSIDTEDPYDTEPGDQALTDGIGSFTLTFKTANTSPGWISTATASGLSAGVSAPVPVNPDAASKLLLLLPGETHNPGSVGGKTGAPDTQQVEVSFDVTVKACDANFNTDPSQTQEVHLADSEGNTMPADANMVAGMKIFSVTLISPTTHQITVTDVDVTAPAMTLYTTPEFDVTPGIVPNAISDLTVLQGSNEGEVTLQWAAPGDDATAGTATSYIVKWDTNQITGAGFDSATTYNQSWTPLYGGSPEGPYTISGFTGGVTYYFAIKAVDDLGYIGSWSESVNTLNYNSAQVDLVEPSAVSDLTALTGAIEGEITLAWTAPGDDESSGTATSYILKWDTLQINTAGFDSATTYSQSWIPQVNGSAEGPYTLAGFNGGVTYYFAIKAVDDLDNKGSWSTIVVNSQNYAYAQIDVSAPCSISDLTAIAGTNEGEIDLAWTAPGDDEGSGTPASYIVKYDTTQITNASFNAAIEYVQLWVPLAAGGSESQTVSGFVPGSTYYFAIKAVDEMGNTGEWSVAGINTLADGPAMDLNPGVPISPTIETVSYCSINLNWTAPNNLDINHYLVYYDSDASGVPYSGTGAVDGMSPIIVPAPPYLLTGLTQKVTYYIAIKTVDDGGYESTYSTEVSTRTPAIPPAVPTSFAGVALSTESIKWTWTDNADNEDGFRILDGSDILVQQLTENTTFWVETVGSPNDAITRKVEVYNEASTVKTSAVLVYTLAAVPDDLGVVAVTSTTINVNWTGSVTGDAESYIVAVATYSACPDNLYAVQSGSLTSPTYEYTVLGLTQQKEYFIKLRVYNADDVVQYTSYVSTVTLDGIAPNQIVDLVGAASTADVGIVDLTWTAPGDDGTQNGDAAMYTIRYSSVIFTADQFDSQPYVKYVVPGSAESAESLSITGLEYGSTYYFAIRTEDEIPNYSAVSNLVVAAASIKHWIGGNGAWNNPSNWLPYGVPVSTHVVLIDAAGCDSNVDANYSVEKIIVNYGTLDLNAYDLTILSTDSDDAVRTSANGGITLNGGNLILNGGFTNNSLSYNLSSGSVTFTGVGQKYFSGVSTSLDQFVIQNGTVVLNLNLDINGDVNIGTSGNLNVSNRTVSIAGDWINQGGGMTAAAGAEIIFDGTSAQTVGGPSDTDFGLAQLTVNKASGALSLGKNMTVAGDVLFDNGTVNAPAGITLSLGNNLSLNNTGIFNMSGSTMTVDGYVLVNASSMLYLTDGAKVVLADGKSIAVNSGGELKSDASNNVITSKTPGVEYYGLVVNSGGTLSITGLLIEYVNSYGLNIKNGATITGNAINNLTVQNIQNGGAAVNLEFVGSAHTYTMDNINFADASIATNVSAANLIYPASITLTNYTGIRGGESYDNDPAEPGNDTIVWILETNPPSGITDLSAAAHTTINGAAKLMFTVPVDDTGVTNYQIRYASYAVAGDSTAWWNNASSASAVAVAAVGNPETLSVTGLTAWTTYYFAARPRDSSGNIGPFPTYLGTPDTPGALASDKISPTIGLLIQDGSEVNSLAVINGTASDTLPGSGLSSIQLQIIDVSGSKYWNGSVWSGVEVSSVIVASGSWSYSTVPAWESNKVYRLKSKVQDIAGLWSAEVQVQFTFDDIAPGVISDLEASPTGSSGEIELTFTVPYEDSTNVISLYPYYYDIRYDVNDFSTGTFVTRASSISYNGTTLPGTKFTAAINGLSDGIIYYFHIKAVDLAGNTSDMDISSPTANSSSGDLEAPEEISDLTASSTEVSTAIDLTWSVPHENGNSGGAPESYEIGYATFMIAGTNYDDASKWDVTNGNASVGDTLTATITGLTTGNFYYFRIRSIDDAGNYSDLDIGLTASAYAGDALKPNQITDLSALTPSSGSGHINLSWTTPYEDGLSGGPPASYKIAYGTASFSSEDFDYQTVIAITHTSKLAGETYTYTLDDLSPQVLYYIRIIAIDDSDNESDASNRVSAYASYTSETDISGAVTKEDGSVITGVIVNAILNGETVSTDNTEDGIYRLESLTAGTNYRVEATWTVNGITSSVYIDDILAGTGDVDFTLEVDYELGSVEGQLASVAVASRGNVGTYVASAVPSVKAFIELLQNGRVVAKKYTDLNGNYSIKNLLPGEYHIRAFNGIGYSIPQKITIGEGAVVQMDFKFSLLLEKNVYNYPNPCRTQTTIRFTTDCLNIEAQILIFTISGELVKEIKGPELSLQGNEYSYEWNLTNSGGEEVASGVYLYQIKVKNKDTQEKTTVIKKIAVIK